jgi:pimeloyl-ACP methyl ester carboxylesterase
LDGNEVQDGKGSDIMKVLQWMATVVLVVAGFVLLAQTSGAQTASTKAAFVPTRFTVVDEGTVGKPDMVLIPGLSSGRAVWDAEAKLLAPNYRLHLVQVDGFAGAPAGPNATGPLLGPMVEELHGYIGTLSGKPVVMGHSLGGLLTLMLEDKYPADVRKAIIVDTLPFYSLLFNPAATVATVKPQADAIKAQMLGMPADQYAAMAPMIAATLVKDPEGQKLVTASSIASDRAVVVNAMIEDMETDMRPEVASIKVPTLVLYEYPTGSSTANPAQYEALVVAGYKPMPNVTLVKVDDSRHFIMYDQPAKFDAAVEQFLR